MTLPLTEFLRYSKSVFHAKEVNVTVSVLEPLASLLCDNSISEENLSLEQRDATRRLKKAREVYVAGDFTSNKISKQRLKNSSDVLVSVCRFFLKLSGLRATRGGPHAFKHQATVVWEQETITISKGEVLISHAPKHLLERLGAVTRLETLCCDSIQDVKDTDRDAGRAVNSLRNWAVIQGAEHVRGFLEAVLSSASTATPLVNSEVLSVVSTAPIPGLLLQQIPCKLSSFSAKFTLGPFRIQPSTLADLLHCVTTLAECINVDIEFFQQEEVNALEQFLPGWGTEDPERAGSPAATLAGRLAVRSRFGGGTGPIKVLEGRRRRRAATDLRSSLPVEKQSALRSLGKNLVLLVGESHLSSHVCLDWCDAQALMQEPAVTDVVVFSSQETTGISMKPQTIDKLRTPFWLHASGVTGRALPPDMNPLFRHWLHYRSASHARRSSAPAATHNPTSPARVSLPARRGLLEARFTAPFKEVSVDRPKLLPGLLLVLETEAVVVDTLATAATAVVYGPATLALISSLEAVYSRFRRRKARLAQKAKAKAMRKPIKLPVDVPISRYQQVVWFLVPDSVLGHESQGSLFGPHYDVERLLGKLVEFLQLPRRLLSCLDLRGISEKRLRTAWQNQRCEAQVTLLLPHECTGLCPEERLMQASISEVQGHPTSDRLSFGSALRTVTGVGSDWRYSRTVTLESDSDAPTAY
ncbi:MAG: uncharacterized protein KVP18_002014 [Porospora cf. gigantea A]|uniref:uncharacterized protein n=1 Tax=Porospora cf. gigantea A TaxID=2853593 RepID=UPI003559DA1D|nr:MAG: hypothetical protein KVP18_002014 [Porospora cf. gigantea A]